jgi:hypothetical protein
MRNLIYESSFCFNVKKNLTRLIDFILAKKGLVLIFILGFLMLYQMCREKRWRNKTIIAHDVSGYYSYLHSTFILNDIHFKKNYDELKKTYPDLYDPNVTPQGKRYIKYAIGMSYAYTPFFLGGIALAKIMNYPVDGYSTPFEVMILFSGLVYGFIGLLYLRKLLLLFFTERVALLTIILVLFSTNLLYYVMYEGGMTHAINFTLFAALIYYTCSFAQKRSANYYLAILICVSFLTVIRPVNFLAILIPLFFDPFGQMKTIERLRYIIGSGKIILLTVLVPAIFIFPQLIYWKITTGHWIYYSYGTETFDFSNPQIVNALFSYRKGWLVYAPIWFFLLPGLMLLYKRSKNAVLFTLIFFAIYIFIVFSWWSWYYGGSFGSRVMIDIYPLLAIALGAFINWCVQTKFVFKIISSVVFIFLIKLNLHQTFQYKVGLMHWSEMDKDTYWMLFGRDGLNKKEWEYANEKWRTNYK